MSHLAYGGHGDRYKEQNLTQGQKAKGQKKNSDGAYVYRVDMWKQLDRFLILGSEGGSYYATEQKLTKNNIKAVEACIAEDGQRTVDRITEISSKGRAPKNDPALFALAAASSLGDEATRIAAYSALPDVARIGTHLFHFIAYREQFSGWSRGLRNAVSRWYNGKRVDNLAFQCLKYRQRDGWSHRDLLRLAHVKPKDELYAALYKWITHPDEDSIREYIPLVDAYLRVQDPTISETDLLALITAHKLPLELIPTAKRSDAVYRYMADIFGMTALLRNLSVLTSRSIIGPMRAENNTVAQRLTNQDAITQSRIHPLQVLTALGTYTNGHGMRGSLSWTPEPVIIDALNEMFHLSFGNIQPSNKRTMLALDVSGSMTYSMSNLPLTCREASAAMAMVTARTEPIYMTYAFSGSWSQPELGPLAISPTQRLDDVLHMISDLPFGNTDCSLPMVYATKQRIPVDTFIIYTDSETNSYAAPDPATALRRYRSVMNIDAKLVVVAMVANSVSIADPDDAGMLDVVGFDTATPEIMSAFARGEI